MNFDLLILFSATTQFKLQPVNKNNVEGIKGKTLSLEWKFSGLQENHVIVNSALYFNVTKPAVKALICNSWLNSITQVIPLFPFVTTRGRNLFGDRISVSYKSNTYNFTLTNLQYNNTGPYFLQVAVGSRKKELLIGKKCENKKKCFTYSFQLLLENITKAGSSSISC